MKIAVVGKRNAGKSTLINAIAGKERVIVSEVPGTTRDAIDVRFERHGKTFVVIDTAGVRKRGKMADSIEFYSFARAQRSVKRADVILLLIDSTVPISTPDKKLASFIAEQYKPCILVVNKWDLAKDIGKLGRLRRVSGQVVPVAQLCTDRLYHRDRIEECAGRARSCDGAFQAGHHQNPHGKTQQGHRDHQGRADSRLQKRRQAAQGLLRHAAFRFAGHAASIRQRRGPL